MSRSATDAPPTLRHYLEAVTHVAFQSGMGASVVDAKWDGFLDAFHGFDPDAVASLSGADVDRLATDPRIIRNRRKIEATVGNARRLLELDGGTDGAGFRAWLSDQPDPATRDRALVREFAFVGPAGVRQFLYRVGITDDDCEHGR